MINLKTNPSTLTALDRAARGALTAEDIERQRLSFVMGAIDTDSNLTRADVAKILNAQSGSRAA